MGGGWGHRPVYHRWCVQMAKRAPEARRREEGSACFLREVFFCRVNMLQAGCRRTFIGSRSGRMGARSWTGSLICMGSEQRHTWVIPIITGSVGGSEDNLQHNEMATLATVHVPVCTYTCTYLWNLSICYSHLGRSDVANNELVHFSCWQFMTCTVYMYIKTYMYRYMCISIDLYARLSSGNLPKN